MIRSCPGNNCSRNRSQQLVVMSCGSHGFLSLYKDGIPLECFRWLNCDRALWMYKIFWKTTTYILEKTCQSFNQLLAPSSLLLGSTQSFLPSSLTLLYSTPVVNNKDCFVLLNGKESGFHDINNHSRKSQAAFNSSRFENSRTSSTANNTMISASVRSACGVEGFAGSLLDGLQWDNLSVKYLPTDNLGTTNPRPVHNSIYAR